MRSACSRDAYRWTQPFLTATTVVRLINASSSTPNFSIDGTAIAPIGLAAVSDPVSVSSGSHQLRVTSPGGTTTTLTVQTSPSGTVTAIAGGNATSLYASVLVDTGSVVPAGKSKLRVVHLAPNATNIEIWRTQPDFPTPTHIMTPFAYLAASPYLQSDPGNWEVFVTPANGTAKLATSGPIAIPSGEHRTVVLLDSAGVMRLRLLPNEKKPRPRGGDPAHRRVLDHARDGGGHVIRQLAPKPKGDFGGDQRDAGTKQRAGQAIAP